MRVPPRPIATQRRESTRRRARASASSGERASRLDADAEGRFTSSRPMAGRTLARRERLKSGQRRRSSVVWLALRLSRLAESLPPEASRRAASILSARRLDADAEGRFASGAPAAGKTPPRREGLERVERACGEQEGKHADPATAHHDAVGRASIESEVDGCRRRGPLICDPREVARVSRRLRGHSRAPDS